jgi:hypothetical protein
MLTRVADVFNGDPPDEPKRPRHIILRELRQLCKLHISDPDALDWHLGRLSEVESLPMQMELFSC